MQKRTPRPYQADLINDYWTALHAGYMCPVIVLSTGGGKTFIFTYITEAMRDQGHVCMILCHRSELIRQITSSLATQGIHHDMICSDKTRAICGNVQQAEFGRTFYQPGAPVIVASVQTINSRIKDRGDKMTPKSRAMREALIKLMKRVTFFVFDEAHHLLAGNTFGRPLEHANPGYRALLVTATPERADGQGIGNAALGGSGITDLMIQGPGMRWLIEQGNLCDYEIFEPPTEQADLTQVRITSSGDYNNEDQAREMNKARITGDVVRHYQELIYGKLTIVFCCDIKHAESVAAAYMDAGIPAAVLHGGDDEHTRFKTINAFERRDIWVLVTVDLVSEGFDLPAIEAAQFLRRTLSLGWFMQAFGRVLRPAPGKKVATILDHVGNWREHGLPDRPRVWSLADRRGASKKDDDPDAVPVTTCRALVCKGDKIFTPEQIAAMDRNQLADNMIRPCTMIYPITSSRCPKCGQRQPLAPRGQPVKVDGQLVQVPLEELERMRAGDDISDQAAIWRQEIQGDMIKLNMTPEAYVNAMHVPAIARQTQIDNHRRWRALHAVRKPLQDEWMEYHQRDDITKEAAQELFLKRFGVNVYHAQVLKPKECSELITKLEQHLAQIHEKGGLTYVT